MNPEQMTFVVIVSRNYGPFWVDFGNSVFIAEVQLLTLDGCRASLMVSPHKFVTLLHEFVVPSHKLRGLLHKFTALPHKFTAPPHELVTLLHKFM
ncbi:hypothetical protein [Lentibacillus jeotgali]|uniref:hypothetical protein n=1 Tax=Lentibacillus jeotgali TaxID=558169 RepID=UPI00110FDB3E|nr:hypothetical protein [Lentibacillus jeotgali]